MTQSAQRALQDFMKANQTDQPKKEPFCGDFEDESEYNVVPFVCESSKAKVNN